MTTASEKAVSVFRQAPVFATCAQAVVYGFEGKDTQLYKDMLQCGGGKAPNGDCGAVYAVKVLRPDLEELVTKQFIEKAKSVNCQSIKSHGSDSYPCHECVRLAASLIESNPMK